MNKKQILNLFRLWHRYIGLAAAIFILLLALTGVLLQHADSFGLDKRYVNSRSLLNWYGIQADPVISYQAAEQTVSHTGNTLFLDTLPLDGSYKDLKGAIASAQTVMVVSNESLMMFTKAGALVDVLKYKQGLPDVALGIAHDVEDGVVMRGLTAYWASDHNGLTWHRYEGEHPVWSKPIETPEVLLQQVQQSSMENDISIERLLLDAHSGRLFGKYGIWLMDLAAIAMLLLAVSGIYMWSQNGSNGKRNNAS